jgi:four helix bundle protein
MGFDAFDVALDLVRSLKEPIAKIAAHDPALADQLRRARSSVPLNLREGRRRAGRDRLHHWRVAAGSADEIVGALLVGEALDYVTRDDIAASLGFADRVLAMCWQMTHA